MNIKHEFDWPGRLDAADREGVAALYNAVNRTESLIGFPRELTREEGACITERLDDDLRRGRCELMLIRSHEAVVGMVILSTSALPNCKHIVELTKGIIHPDQRATGLLRCAFLEVARHCKERGLERVVLDVRENSRSHQIWSYLGFREFGRLEDYARVDGNVFSGVYMHQSVDDLMRALTTNGQLQGV